MIVDHQVINFLDASFVEQFYHSFDGKWLREDKGTTGKRLLVTYHNLQGKKKLTDRYIRDIIATPALEGIHSLWFGASSTPVVLPRRESQLPSHSRSYSLMDATLSSL